MCNEDNSFDNIIFHLRLIHLSQGECLTETQRNVASKFITGVLAKTVKKRQPAVTYEYEPEEDEKEKEGSVTNDGEKPGTWLYTLSRSVDSDRSV